MTIQFNTGKDLTVREGFREKLTEQLETDLSRFDEFITRLEVHLTDENGEKAGQDDKKCLLEARVKNKQPIVVTAFSDNYELAVSAASVKLKKLLNTVVEKMQDR